MIKLIRSELMKIWTTNVWLLFGIGVFLFTAIALAFSIATADYSIHLATQPPQPPEGSEEVIIPGPEWSNDLTRVLQSSAATIYTSGQYFGILFVMLLGAILITNEFYHQTATATFLTTPVRVKVIVSKLITAVIAAAFFWIGTTLLNVIVGTIYFNSQGYSPQLTEWPVVRAVLMNGLAFGLWGILGVGLGVLVRNQIAAVVLGAVAYIIATPIVQGAFYVVYALWIERDWVLQAMVAVPSIASTVMISPEKTYAQSPEWWVGALVLVGYGIVFGTIGTLITRRRDIS